MKLLHYLVLLLGASSASAFVTPSRALFHPTASRMPTSISTPDNLMIPHIQNQRKSVANVQTASLFGLGPAELVIIGVAAVFVLGPEKISEMMRQSGKMAGEMKDEFKEVPAEFKKGLEEGETNVRAKSAKQMEEVKEE